MSAVWKFFKETYDGNGGMTKFRQDWQELTEQDRAQLRKGIEDSSLNY